MKHKIEPGMLCLVIGDENGMKQCIVIRRLKVDEYVPEVNGTSDEESWLVKGPEILAQYDDKLVFLGGYGAETKLLPINGIADDSEDAIVKERDEVSVCG
jgi:hypothetical protein